MTMIQAYSLQLERALMTLEGNLPGGPTTQGLKGEDHHQDHHLTPLEGTTLLELVQVHIHQSTPHIKTASILEFHATLHLTLMDSFHIPNPTPYKGKDCIREYNQNHQLPQ